MDDIMFKIPSVYPTSLYYNHYGFDNSLIDDIKDQVYKHLNENEKFKRDCTKVNQVWVVFPDSFVKTFMYIDGVLYYPGLDDVSLNRAIKLKKLDV